MDILKFVNLILALVFENYFMSSVVEIWCKTILICINSKDFCDCEAECAFHCWQGYRAEMDNPTMVLLLPPILRNRKDVLFGNMSEIYDFHNR